MPIVISKKIKSKLPDEEKKDIESKLWNKSGQVCFLCGKKLIESSEKIVADHDKPDSESDDVNENTNIANLNLVHDSCNSFKRNHPTVDVRPYLKLLVKIREKGSPVKYDEVCDLLGITLNPIDLVDNNSEVQITSDSGVRTYPVFSEINKSGLHRFFFAELSKPNIYNDDDCQPRNINTQHLWQIYNDLNRNPLHEAPACRLEKEPGSQQTYKALMFDGQHKTVAMWISGKSSIVTKIYLDITKDQAVRLVNSIQAKIKKLPLSPFELSAKMAEEWQERIDKYESIVGSDKASESGFISWVEQDERTRAKAAFADALFQNILDKDELLFRDKVLKPGEKQSGSQKNITEAAFRNKLLKPMLHTSPLKEFFQESQSLRNREADNIVKLLNIVYGVLFIGENDGQLSPQEEIRLKRAIYQSSLNYVASLIRSLVGHIIVVEHPRQLLDKPISTESWSRIEEGIKRLYEHPVWTADEESTEKMSDVMTALTKNQSAEKVFGDVQLKLGYVVGADNVDSSCLE